MTRPRLEAFASSLEKEMPTATGVFSSERSQPYMPADVEEKLAICTMVKILFRKLLLHNTAL